MSTRESAGASPPIESKADLIAWIARGAKPKSDWRIGTEHEKFVFDVRSRMPVPYEGPAGIRALMEQLQQRYGWLPIREGETTIALKRPAGELARTISLEPGGQFELSGAIVATLHATHAETAEHLDQVRAIGRDLGLGFIGLGFCPTWSRDAVPTMPKRRYAVMTRYMPKVGTRGLDMMYRTSTVQTNLDFGSETDMVQKLRVSLALQPVATALFASSPFTEGRLNGFKSARSEVWRHTDANRTGMLPFAFEAGMGYERYVDYALDVPMYFVYRDGRYIDVAGASFRDFMAGRLAALPGERATMDDWSDHMTTLFPEVRLKRFLEMRGADSGSLARIVALPAFWVGLLYEQGALDQASALIADWTADDRQRLRDDAPGLGLEAAVGGRSLREVAVDVVRIARAGLQARAAVDEMNRDETMYLAPVEEIAATGRTTADILLERYAEASSLDAIFDDVDVRL
jgi:glutamate--cysteine ligase